MERLGHDGRWVDSLLTICSHRDLLGRYELIEAHDIEEAVEITQGRFPDCTVMREGSERICSA